MQNYSPQNIIKYNFFYKYKYIFIFAWIFIFLNPVLFSGFTGDDAYNSQIYGGNLSAQKHWFYDDWWGGVKLWFNGAGRFNFFLSIFTKGIFYYIHNFFLIKLIVIVSICLNVYVFGKILEILKIPENFILTTLLISPLFFQIRDYHDPLSSFFLLIPATTTFCFLSYYFYLKHKNKINLFLSFFFLNLGIFSYEVAFIMVPIYLLNFLFNKDKNYFSLFLALYPILVFVCAKFYHFHYGFKLSYPNIHIQDFFNLKIYFQSYFIQLISTFPLTWRLAIDHSFAFVNLGSATLGILLFFYLKKYNLIVKKKYYNQIFKSELIIFCVVIIFITPLITAVSGHNLDIVKRGFGYAYLPVYFQYFGLMPVIAFLVIYSLDKFQANKLKYLLLFMLIFTAGLTYRSNYKIIEYSNDRSLHAPKFIEKFLPRFTNIVNPADNKLFIRYYNIPHDHLWNYTKVANKLINTCYLDNDFKNCLQKHHEKYPKKSEYYGTAYSVDNVNKNNYAILVKLKNYENIMKMIDYNIIEFNEYYFLDKNNKLYKNKTNSNFNFFKIAKQGITSSYQNFNINNFKIDEYPISLKNFWPIEFKGDQKLSWLSKNGIIKILNNQNKIQKGYFYTNIIRPGKSNIYVKIVDQNKNILLDKILSGGEYTFSFPITLNKGDNEITIVANGEEFKNGDPRKIKIGIANWKFNKNK